MEIGFEMFLTISEVSQVLNMVEFDLNLAFFPLEKRILQFP